MNLKSNDGELVVVETLRQEICFSALTLRASKSFSIDRSSRRQTPHLTLLYFFVSHVTPDLSITPTLFLIQIALQISTSTVSNKLSNR